MVEVFSYRAYDKMPGQCLQLLEIESQELKNEVVHIRATLKFLRSRRAKL